MSSNFVNRFWLSAVLFLIAANANAQSPLVSESILKKAKSLSAQLPASINEAYEQSGSKKLQYDSLEQLIKEAYPLLAGKMKKRSAKLNAMAGYDVADATLSLVPANQKMSDFFRAEWEKMDALEAAFSRQVKSFYGKDLYQKNGYLAVWDSVYKQRIPALVKYRDGIIKLVEAEIAYLKANEKMFVSSNEPDRMQYVEAELSLLQKLVLLRDKYKRVVMDDGVEKVVYCKTYPQNCENADKN
jgi:hypothetical protein